MTKKLPPVHPGEVLTEDFLNPMHLTPYGVAALMGVPRTRIERLAHRQTAVTADTALRLGRFFGVSPAFWMNIQNSIRSRARGGRGRVFARRHHAVPLRTGVDMGLRCHRRVSLFPG